MGVQSEIEPSSLVYGTPSAGGDVEAVGVGVGNAGLGELKRRTTQGALVSMGAQVGTLLLRTGSMMILARLVLPKDFGLVGMVTAFTGFLSLFRDFGLAMATVQQITITEGQKSTLFWINLAVGAVLAGLSVLIAPVLVYFYGQPQLFWVTVALGSSFLINGAAAQHRAILQRNLRFVVLAAIDTLAMSASIALAIALAVAGRGYWALVMMTISQSVATTAGVWLAARWIPGPPQRQAGIRAMLRYGGTFTLNTVIVYFAYNAEKVLLGRFWGAEALGLYGRAYQLVNLPTDNLNSTIGSVAFPALSRLQNDPARLRTYFLRGYGLFLSITMPITMACALFAEDIIAVFLGPKWQAAANVFRLLAPTTLALALINPFGSLLLATGRVMRSLKIALLIAPVVMAGYLSGLGGGPQGLAAGYSIAMLLLVVPVVCWAKHGTAMSLPDIFNTVKPPLLSVLASGVVALALRQVLECIHNNVLRLCIESGILFGSYLVVLLFVMKQRPVYLRILMETGLWPDNLVAALQQKLKRGKIIINRNCSGLGGRS